MTITEPNFEELQNLCKERGFHDINQELPVLRGETRIILIGFKSLGAQGAREDAGHVFH